MSAAPKEPDTDEIDDEVDDHGDEHEAHGEPGSYRIGACGFGGSRHAYYRQLSLVEVQETAFQPPALAALERWKQQAPADFMFTVRASQLITHEADSPVFRRAPKGKRPAAGTSGHFRDTAVVSEAYAQTLSCAKVLEARALLFETPASFTPTATNRAAMTRFFESVARPAGVALVWEARGVWTPAEVQRISDDLDLVPAIDPVEAELDEGGAFGYFRLHGARYGDAERDLLLDALEAFDEVCCLFSTSERLADALRLQRALTQL